MEDLPLKACFITALTITGLLCGASLDQSLKQLPARHVIGAVAFSAYAKAADLKNGVAWYAVLGIGSALASVLTTILVLTHHAKENYSLSLYLAGFFAVCHTACTALAAPTYHKQKQISDDAELKKMFDKFERIQTFRSIFIILNLSCFIWTVAIL